MRINLNQIVDMPGKSLDFECELEKDDFLNMSVASLNSTPTASGSIRNSAGALSLEGVIKTDSTKICDRCSVEFPCVEEIKVSAHLAAELEDEDNPDIFLLDGTYLDLTEVLTTLFVLNSDMQCLCSDDCLGLCCDCGANLNDGDCDCQTETDPRLAVLSQLLDIED